MIPVPLFFFRQRFILVKWAKTQPIQSPNRVQHRKTNNQASSPLTETLATMDFSRRRLPRVKLLEEQDACKHPRHQRSHASHGHRVTIFTHYHRRTQTPFTDSHPPPFFIALSTRHRSQIDPRELLGLWTTSHPRHANREPLESFHLAGELHRFTRSHPQKPKPTGT